MVRNIKNPKNPKQFQNFKKKRKLEKHSQEIMFEVKLRVLSRHRKFSSGTRSDMSFS